MAKKKQRSSLPEMRAFLACEAFSPDSSGKKTLFGLFDMIWSDTLPGVFKPFVLYARLAGGTGKHSVSIRCIGADGKPFSPDLSIEGMMKKGEDIDVFIQILGAPLVRQGELRFSLMVDGQTTGWPLRIAVKQGHPK